ncbi:MAG: hypothetical protein VB085_08750 [Peptococcaceae bacterium]|nr:hypothetical protein [Peptococcaceae bacterium]
MDEKERQEIRQNKAIRGYIMRALAKGYRYSLLTRQIANALQAEGLIISPDISRHLDYLVEAGYVEITTDRVNAYQAYQNDAVLRLTKEGIDLIEGSTEDPGVDL